MSDDDATAAVTVWLLVPGAELLACEDDDTVEADAALLPVEFTPVTGVLVGEVVPLSLDCPVCTAIAFESLRCVVLLEAVLHAFVLDASCDTVDVSMFYRCLMAHITR